MDDIAMPSDFFYPTSCILCLESNATSYINIYSSEGKQLGIEKVIVKHFWLQPNEELPKARSICQRCWKSVYTFHEFYLQVERAHKLLDEETPIVFCETAVEDPIGENVHIKVELEEMGENTPIVSKSKRGRPRSKKSSNELCKISRKKSQLKSENINESTTMSAVTSSVPKKSKNVSRIEKVDEGSILADLQDGLPIGTRRSGRLQNQMDLNFDTTFIDTVKDEKQPIDAPEVSVAEEIKRECNSNTSDIQSDAEINSSDNTPHEEKVKNKKPKKEKSEYVVQSDKYDEYISTNFILTCCLCETTFPKFNALKTHFLADHHQRGYAICCNKKFFKRFLLIDHIKLHQNPQTFKCPLCSKVLGLRSSYDLHMKRHEEKKERKYECNVCTKRFFNKGIFVRHMMVHTPEEEKTIPCPDCDKKFSVNYLMKLHHRTVHLNAFAIFCDVCGKSIRGKEAFQRHMDEHSGTIRPTHQCEQCGSKLTSKYNLSKHIRRIHSEESQKPRTCDICGKISPGLLAHQHHVSYMHKMQRVHACTYCDKTFKVAKTLREHLTTHTGDVLYTCTYCPKTFNSNANMYSHRKRAHRKEWEENRLQKFSRLPTDT